MSLSTSGDDQLGRNERLKSKGEKEDVPFQNDNDREPASSLSAVLKEHSTAMFSLPVLLVVIAFPGTRSAAHKF